MNFELNINGQTHEVNNVDSSMPLLWVLRDELGLTGTKYGCGIAICGTCVVLMNGSPVKSCRLPVRAVGKAEITTIEGLSEKGDHPVQEAWIEEDVTQCGYCQGGLILATVALLADNPDPSNSDIDKALDRNLCRCGTHPRIRAAIKNAAKRMAQ